MNIRFLTRLLGKKGVILVVAGLVILLSLCCGTSIFFAARQPSAESVPQVVTATPTPGWTSLDFPTATPTPEPEPTEESEQSGSWIRVGWNGQGGANCHLSLDPNQWEQIIRIPTGTELEVLGEAQTIVVWEGEYTVWLVEFEGQQCYIRTQLAVPLRP